MSPVTSISLSLSDSTPPHPKRTRPTTTATERSLPSANISRIMRTNIPANCKLAKDAKDTMQTCLSAFVAFVTSEAAHQCKREKRKTMNGDDLLAAMQHLGFVQYVQPLNMYLMRYRSCQAAEKEQWAHAPWGPSG